MSAPVPSIAGGPARPGVEVRTQDGVLIKRIAPGAADTLAARGWGEWMRTGRRRYVRLTASAPLSALYSWRGRDGTRPVRADGTLECAAGQTMGDPEKIREFGPTR